MVKHFFSILFELRTIGKINSKKDESFFFVKQKQFLQQIFSYFALNFLILKTKLIIYYSCHQLFYSAIWSKSDFHEKLKRSFLLINIQKPIIDYCARNNIEIGNKV